MKKVSDPLPGSLPYRIQQIRLQKKSNLPEQQPSEPPSKQKFQYKPRSEEQWMLRAYGQTASTTKWTQSARYAAEFHNIRFEWFISVMPSREIHQLAYLQQQFNSFIEELQKALTFPDRRPGTIGYVVCFEPTPTLHIHLCLISRPKAEKALIESLLQKRFGTNPHSPKAVDVQEYDLNRNGVGYALKSIDQGHGDFDFSDLKPFRPNAHIRWLAKKEREMSPFRRAFMKRFRAATGVEEKTGQMTLGRVHE